MTLTNFSKTRKYWGGVAVGVVIGAFVLWQISATPTTPTLTPPDSPVVHNSRQTDAQMDSTLSALLEKIAQLNVRVSSLKDLIDKQGTEISRLKATLDKNPTSPISTASPLSEAALELQMQRQIEERIEKVTTTFEAEPTDWGWTNRALSLIEEKLTGAEFMGGDFIDAECRATLCEIKVKHQNPQQHEEFEFRFPDLLGGTFPRFMMIPEEQPDGSIINTVYAVRAGHDLP
jgi:hypothetical protein